MAAKKPEVKPKAEKGAVVQFDYHGQRYYAWRDDGQRPDFDVEEASKSIHMVLRATLPPDHYGPNKP